MAVGKVLGWALTGAVAGGVVGAFATGIGLGIAAFTVPTAGIIAGGLVGGLASLVGFMGLAACPWEREPTGAGSAVMLSYIAASALTTCALLGYKPAFLSKDAAPVSAEFNEKCKDVKTTVIDGQTYNVVPEGCPAPQTPKK